MSPTSFFFLFTALNCSSAAVAESKMPFKSLESTQFVSRAEDKLLAIGKTSDFIGVVERMKVTDPIFKNVDVYEFKNLKNLKVSKDLCHALAKDVFGEPKKSSFEMKTQEIKVLKSRGGVCFMALSDNSTERSIKEKHFFVVILNLRVYGLTFRHGRAATATEIQDEFNFIESLR